LILWCELEFFAAMARLLALLAGYPVVG